MRVAATGLLLAMAARLEPTGWAMAPANLLMSAGLAAGPLVTGLIFDTQHGPRTIAWVAVVALACSLALLKASHGSAALARFGQGTGAR